MNSLFPDNMEFEEVDPEDLVEEDYQIAQEFKGTYGFDFETGEFKFGPDGKVVKLNKMDSYIQWCQKALSTPRLKHIAYSDVYGHEIEELIGEDISKEAIELEVERVLEEALEVHPFTKEVTSFDFNWDKKEDELYIEFDVITVYDELFTIDHIIRKEVIQ